MTPLFLNPPWSAHERDQARERRHETAARIVLFIIHAATWFFAGFALGVVLTH